MLQCFGINIVSRRCLIDKGDFIFKNIWFQFYCFMNKGTVWPGPPPPSPPPTHTRHAHSHTHLHTHTLIGYQTLSDVLSVKCKCKSHLQISVWVCVCGCMCVCVHVGVCVCVYVWGDAFPSMDHIQWALLVSRTSCSGLTISIRAETTYVPCLACTKSF